MVSLLFVLMTGVQAAEGGDRSRDRLARVSERRAARTLAAEERWAEACQVAERDPLDPRAERSAARCENKLVYTRARHIGVQRQLDALGMPSREVRVLFATNREPHRKPKPGRWYAPRDADRLEYGVATVHIPEDHPVGALERKLEVIRVEVLPPEGFADELSRALAAAGPDAGVLTYVHGYNNSFTYAARRTAQVVHDLDVALVPVLFSWPAHGGTWFAGAKYTFDENEAARSAAPFADLLGPMLEQAGTAPVTVFAHSMGSRVLSDALLDLDRQGRMARPLHHLVLAAPDLDASVFARRYLDLAVAASGGVTLYCASDDRALKLSRGVHGGYDRLGSCRAQSAERLQGAGVEVVDASRLYVDMLDHDKVADSPRLLADLRLLLQGVPASAPERGLVSRDSLFELPP